MNNLGKPSENLKIALEVQRLLKEFSPPKAMAEAHRLVTEAENKILRAGKSDEVHWQFEDISGSFASLESSFNTKSYNTNTDRLKFMSIFLDIVEQSNTLTGGEKNE